MSYKLLGILLVLCSVALESIGQLCLKKGAMTGALTSLRRGCTLLGLGFLTLEILVWTMALHQIDVSMAYPMGSLSFVGILILSHFFLNEKVSPKRWVGVGFIICGTAIVGLN